MVIYSVTHKNIQSFTPFSLLHQLRSSRRKQIIMRGGIQLTANQINYWKNKETERANRELEKHNARSLEETGRHNVVSENQNWANIAESIRHNKSTESETNRHNVASESNEHMSSLGSYYRGLGSQTSANAALQNANTNAAKASWDYLLGSLSQQNKKREINLAISQLEEVRRHNTSTESLQAIETALSLLRAMLQYAA